MTDRAPELNGNPEPHRGMYPIKSAADMQFVAGEMGIPVAILAEQGAHFADRRLAPTQRVPLGAAVVAVGTGTENLTEFWGRVEERIARVDATEREAASRELRRREGLTAAAEMAEQPLGKYPIGAGGAVFRISPELRRTLEGSHPRDALTPRYRERLDRALKEGTRIHNALQLRRDFPLG